MKTVLLLTAGTLGGIVIGFFGTIILEINMEENIPGILSEGFQRIMNDTKNNK